METDETCDVLPYGFIDGRLSAADRLALSRSGAIPAEYVRERAQLTLGAAFGAGALGSLVAVLLWKSNVLGTLVLHMPTWLQALTLAG